MDALELSLRCSALLLRSNSNPSGSGATPTGGLSLTDNAQISHETQWSEADYEKHFKDQGKFKYKLLIDFLLCKIHFNAALQ